VHENQIFLKKFADIDAKSRKNQCFSKKNALEYCKNRQ
jgi:hypothetical protein